MPKIPNPRKPEQKGGEAHLRQPTNRSKSQDRGGRPHAGGAGDGKKPKKS